MCWKILNAIRRDLDSGNMTHVTQKGLSRKHVGTLEHLLCSSVKGNWDAWDSPSLKKWE